jgi:hypothetical protein
MKKNSTGKIKEMSIIINGYESTLERIRKNNQMHGELLNVWKMISNEKLNPEAYQSEPMKVSPLWKNFVNTLSEEEKMQIGDFFEIDYKNKKDKKKNDIIRLHKKLELIEVN